MMMAGATLVGIGTGVYYRGVEIFKKWSKKCMYGARKTALKN